VIGRIVFLSALSVLATASLLMGQTSDLHYSLGLRYEMASWDLDAFYYKTLEDYNNGVATEFGSEIGHLYGPTASLNYQKFGFSVTYLMGSWEYPTYPMMWYIDYYSGDTLQINETETWNRSDLVVTASYRLAPQLSVFVGFKSLTLEDEIEIEVAGIVADTTTEVSGSGAGWGLAGSIPFTPQLHGYGTVGFMYIGGDLEVENHIWEGGLRLYPQNMPFFGSVGYRYESFNGGGTILHGPILTVAFYK
jgi:hypothetical protein